LGTAASMPVCVPGLAWKKQGSPSRVQATYFCTPLHFIESSLEQFL